jgi:hypothetical protein
VSPEPVTPEQLADAYWGNYERRQVLESQRPPRTGELQAGEKVILERPGLRVVAVKRSGDEPRTGLEWAWGMVACIVHSETWHDVYDAREEGREVRVAPAIDRLELLELLAERAPDDEAVTYLGAGALEDYLESNPDIARVEQIAQRSDRVRLALAGVWFNDRMPPDAAARLKRLADGS